MKNFLKSLFSKFGKKETVTISETKKETSPAPVADPEQFKRKFQILTKRPENMSFQDYKIHLKRQREWLKQRKQGFFVYISSEVKKKIVEKPTGKIIEGQEREKKKTTVHQKVTYRPFVGSVKRDLIYPV
jgi:hypothetical protein